VINQNTIPMKFARILLYLTFFVALIFLMSGYGYQWNIWELGTGFTLLRYAAYASIGILAVSVVSLWFLRKSGFQAVFFLIIVLILSGVASGTALFWQQRAQSVPAIHDISTDLESPPEFVAMVRLRADAPNPPEYAGEETANAQREAYPEIQPLMLNADLQNVMDESVMLVLDRGWDLVAINRQEGRIEATEHLAWFGFKDDVVLRFTETETGEGTRVDMRSKSRIGRSDVGVNAKRIEQFLDDLEDRFD
jgi:uncharacterized protein (DUF1499 family)